MRRLSLLGLVIAMLLGAIAVSVTNDNVRASRNEQDRTLEAATSSEIGLIAGGERQTTTALSVMLVNPSVRALLDGGRLSPAQRTADLQNASLTLAAIKRTAFLSLSAACLDNGAGEQLVCAPTARPVVFPTRLGRQFSAMANYLAVGAASGTFISPVSHELSVAFLAPYRSRGRLFGFVHLDINVAATRGGSLVLNQTPGVKIELGSYAGGTLSLNVPSVEGDSGSLAGPSEVPIGIQHLGSHSIDLVVRGHRSLIASLPMTIGRSHQAIAVLASASAANPDFFNAWTSGLLTVLGLALLVLAGSVTGLVVSNRVLERELSTDSLTGLRNRRALMEDLPRACESADESHPAFLWYFDLNGFKRYNDSFGHVAGDALLARLGSRMAEAIGRHGSCYRLGGDEFCALLSGPVDDPHALFLTAREALSERGGAFAVTASAGAVEIPREASDPTQALRLADQRMYRQKGTSKRGAAELITAALHAALAQRHPDLDEHSNDVVGVVEKLARTVGLNESDVDVVMKAGDLHDIGKLGIPDEIISKPGPLNNQEWEFMKQHTVMGEQIIAAAGPSLEPVCPLVRGSHERWDGTGYPDGLAGEEIPLGARIIAICDSFSVMMTTRAYTEAMSLEDAIAELRRCGGSQFDPKLVEIFCRIVSERSNSLHLSHARS
jgi:diguanylate cyclase (GGDEF)-like protein